MCRCQLGCNSGLHGDRVLPSGMGQFYLGETGLVLQPHGVCCQGLQLDLNHLQYVINYKFMTFQAIVCGQECVGIVSLS